MKILAFSGSYRKGKTIDTLIDKAVEGVRSIKGDADVTTIRLIEKKIEYCKNCMACKKVAPSEPFATCVIRDDMDELYPLIDQADGYIFGTPVNCGHVTAVMKTFIERVIYINGVPGDYPLKGCPHPRNQRKKRAVVIVSSGAVPPSLRMFCDDATSLIKTLCDCGLNARVVGSMYAGAVEMRGVEPYLKKAENLGKTLVKP